MCVRVHPQLAPTFEDYHDSELEGRIINESQADDMYEILSDGSKKSIGIGDYVPLTEGRKILLSTKEGGRLVIVQLVNN